MSDKDITKEIISEFFKAAGITHGWQGKQKLLFTNGVVNWIWHQ